MALTDRQPTIKIASRDFARFAGNNLRRWKMAIGAQVFHNYHGEGTIVAVKSGTFGIALDVRFRNSTRSLSTLALKGVAIPRMSISRELYHEMQSVSPTPAPAPAHPITDLSCVKPIVPAAPNQERITMYAVADYWPVSSGQQDDWSRRIIDLKNGCPAAIKYFTLRLDPIVRTGTPIVTVPSHDSRRTTTSGIRSVAQGLARRQRTDATACLVRHTTVEKLSKGGRRSVDLHLDSIRVENSHLIDTEHVLLLDDVGTTGRSLVACRQLLLAAGVADVTCLVLGWTVSNDRYR